MFETNPKSLKEILRRIEQGELQLPDFQRDWVWDDDGVRSLLASIASGFPIGALLTLATGGDVRFKPRALAHAPDLGKEPAELLLDGQQRMTSCYQALKSKNPVTTRNAKGREINVYYFMNMLLALENASRLDACIFSVPTDRKLKTNFNRDIVLDVSTDERQFEQHMFPLNATFASEDWFLDYQMHHGSEGRARIKEFKQKVLSKLTDYQIPIIKLTKENSRAAVCTVFEKVNVGGKKLDAFELLTAIFAADEFDLREDMRGPNGGDGRLNRIKGLENYGVFHRLDERDILQVAILLQTYDQRIDAIAAGETEQKRIPAVSIKADALLDLKCEVYQDKRDIIEQGFIKARQFFNELKIINERDIPYLPASKTIAAVFALKGRRELNVAAKKRLERWFWCISLGERYGKSTDTTITKDVLELMPWLDGGDIAPRTVLETNIHINRLDQLKTRLAAGYKAINAALLSEGCLDFRTGKAAYQMAKDGDSIDIHHIFPQSWCRNNNITADRFDTVVNKTPLLQQTNQIIGGNAPSRYLEKLGRELERYNSGNEQYSNQEDILDSHLIGPDFLSVDDFDGFYLARKEALARLIERKTGMRVAREELE